MIASESREYFTRNDPLRKEQEILQTMLPSVASSAITPAIPGVSVSAIGVKSALLALLLFRRGRIVIHQRVIMSGNDRNVFADELLDIAQVRLLLRVTK